MTATLSGDSMAIPFPQDHPLPLEAVVQAWPPVLWRDLHVMVALSGGADSVALLRILAEIQGQTTGAGRLQAAHFNHRLRGDDSDADETWVRETCAKLGVPLVVGQRETPSNAAEKSYVSEEAAREDRYAFLQQAAEATGARFVATAHTEDDQVETLLFRLFRGSGLAGLSGAPFTRPLGPGVTLVRPLLEVRRETIEAYLADLGQDFRHDQSNDETRYTRNWIRNELLPQIRQRMGESVVGSLVNLSQQAAETQTLVDRLAAGLVERAFEIDVAPSQVTVDRDKLTGEPALLVCEAFRQAWRAAGWPEQEMGRQQWRRLVDFSQASVSTPAIMLPGGIRIEHFAGSVVLAPGFD